MSIFIERLYKVDQYQWNARVGKRAEGTIWQTTHIIPVMRVFGYEPVFLVARDQDSQVLGQLLLFSGSPCPNFLLGAPGAPFTLYLSKRLFNTYNWYYGPLIFAGQRYEQILTKFLDYLRESSRKEGNFLVKDVVPPIHSGGLDQEVIRNIFTGRGFTSQQAATISVDLDKDMDSLWADLKKGSRYDVKKAMREGAEIVDADSLEDIKQYYRLRVEAAKRGSLERPVDYARAALNHLRPLGMYRLFLARQKRLPLSAIGCFQFNGVVMQCGLANSAYALENKVFTMHLLTWHIIKWAQGQGYRCLDLMGFNPNQEERSEKEEGIFRFKNRWGGKTVRYYTYSQAYSPVKNRIYSLIKGRQ